MIRSALNSLSASCIVHRTELLLRSIATTTCLSTDKRFDPQHDAVRQEGGVTQDIPLDTVVPHEKLKSSFPTLETHSESFDGMKYTDLPIVHVKSSRNNTILTATQGNGRPIALQSAGTVGFRNAKKGTNVAGQAAAIALAGDVLRKNVKTVRVCLKGLGPGRLPAVKALEMSGLQIVSITDTTPLSHTGGRPKKARRL